MRNTLQARLITSMVMSSLFLIAAFAAIQLYNQLQSSAESNLYRANVGAIFTRDKLERLFSGLDREASPSVVENKIKNIFLSALHSRIIDNAILLDENATPLISEGKIKSTFTYDKKFLNEIYRSKTKSKWLFPVIDKDNRVIYLFVMPENIYGYFVQLTFSLGSLKEAVNDVYAPVRFMVIAVIVANIVVAVLLSRALISPVKILNRATKNIARGNLDEKISIKTKDELEELADTFNYMTVELKRMKAKAENANPLTKLPGNVVIREEVERRIKSKEKFILIYCDLDNFKAFNDKYGVHAGDEVIMFTAKIFEKTIAKNGARNDFIGHEGGDDFLLLTSPEKAEVIAGHIIVEFDKGIIEFYSEKDAGKGYIEATARDSDRTVKFPIMSISMAGVSNVLREITSFSQLTNIAAGLKKAAKKYGKSNFLMDRRGDDLGAAHRGKQEEEKKADTERRDQTGGRRSSIEERRDALKKRRKQNE
ncbi:MAG: GGDEF domain-containing protein [Omnitrophica bacterium]|nr:GGDEF domain-containing protein [Candidatus Omnitrophota bacterium]